VSRLDQCHDAGFHIYEIRTNLLQHQKRGLLLAQNGSSKCNFGGVMKAEGEDIKSIPIFSLLKTINSNLNRNLRQTTGLFPILSVPTHNVHLIILPHHCDYNTNLNNLILLSPLNPPHHPNRHPNSRLLQRYSLPHHP
jgi:hypothetical protein